MLRFNPKEDIASSTSIKTSIQRTIRTKLLAQIPLLSSPALPFPKSAKSTAVDSDDESGAESEEDAAGAGREFGGGKKAKELRKEAKGRGPGKGKDAKKARRAAAEAEEEVEDLPEGEEEEVLTLLDVLWPKKEGLTLIKWFVSSLRLFDELMRNLVEIIFLFSRCMGNRSSSSISTDRIIPPSRSYIAVSTFHLTLSESRIDKRGADPSMLPHVQVDRGAIKFVLAGANIMWCVSHTPHDIQKLTTLRRAVQD